MCCIAGGAVIETIAATPIQGSRSDGRWVHRGLPIVLMSWLDADPH
jgi:hypothetical protein